MPLQSERLEVSKNSTPGLDTNQTSYQVGPLHPLNKICVKLDVSAMGVEAGSRAFGHKGTHQKFREECCCAAEPLA